MAATYASSSTLSLKRKRAKNSSFSLPKIILPLVFMCEGGQYDLHHKKSYSSSLRCKKCSHQNKDENLTQRKEFKLK